jgi:hypothetical protein
MWGLIALVIIFFFVLLKDNSEHFYGNYVAPWPTRITRPTRNMSYDLRGEAYYPPLLNLPFDNSSIAPVPQPQLIDKRNICV